MIESLISSFVVVFAMMLTLCVCVSLWVATMTLLEKFFGSMKK